MMMMMMMMIVKVTASPGNRENLECAGILTAVREVAEN